MALRRRAAPTIASIAGHGSSAPAAGEGVSARLQRAPIEIAGGAEAIEVGARDRRRPGRGSDRALGEQARRGDQLVLGAVDLVERGGAGELEARQGLLVAEAAQHDGGDADQARHREQDQPGVDRDQRGREPDAAGERASRHRPKSRRWFSSTASITASSRSSLMRRDRAHADGHVGRLVARAGLGPEHRTVGLDQQALDRQPAHQLLLLRRADDGRRHREEEAGFDRRQRGGRSARRRRGAARAWRFDSSSRSMVALPAEREWTLSGSPVSAASRTKPRKISRCDLALGRVLDLPVVEPDLADRDQPRPLAADQRLEARRPGRGRGWWGRGPRSGGSWRRPRSPRPRRGGGSSRRPPASRRRRRSP